MRDAMIVVVGVIGVVAYGVRTTLLSRRSSDSWRALIEERRALGGGAFDAPGAARIGNNYVSVPLARIVVADDYLAVFSRWPWLGPLPPTRIARSAVATLRLRPHSFSGHARLDVEWEESQGSVPVRIWINQETLAKIEAAGWKIGTTERNSGAGAQTARDCASTDVLLG